MDTIDDDDPLGTVLPALDKEPQIQECSKQTAKHGKPFGNPVCNPVRKPLQVKKCSVNLQREQDENTKPEKNKILEKQKTTKNKKTKGKDINKNAEKKEKDTEKKNQEEANIPKEKPVKEEKSESKDKIHGEDIPVDSKEKAKPIQKVDMKNKEDESKKEEMVEKDSKVETEQKSEKSFHIEMAIVLDGNSVEDIHKDSMEVIGDSLKIKKLEDQIEDMLTTRTKVKDTQKRIQTLESILSSLKKGAFADEQREIGEKNIRKIKS